MKQDWKTAHVNQWTVYGAAAAAAAGGLMSLLYLLRASFTVTNDLMITRMEMLLALVLAKNDREKRMVVRN